MAKQAPPSYPTKWKGVSSRGITYEIVACVFFSVAFITVILRVTARLKQFGRLFRDDVFSIISGLLGLGFLGIAVVFVQSYGMGWPQDELPLAQIEKFYELFFAGEILYAVISPTYKLAVIFLYQRIFGTIRTFKIASWIMVGFSIAYAIAGSISTIFQCWPVAKAWDASLPGHCVNIEAYILGLGIANMLIDATILCMPLPCIWKLNLGLRRKIALTSMFLLGSIVVLASILRITYLIPINVANGTYVFRDVAIWSAIEPAAGIIAACLPTLRRFVFGGGQDWDSKGEDYSYGTGSHKMDSTQRSNTAVALTGWRTDTYVEVKSQTTGSRTPKREDIESNRTYANYQPAERIPQFDRNLPRTSNNEIRLNHDVSVLFSDDDDD